jgi:hypothetical protein
LARLAHGVADRSTAIELACSVVLIALATRYLVHFIRVMADTSLWNDELFSAIGFSGRGPGHTVTTYTSANNHIFFNLLNAITPGRGSVDPLRARMWSLVAIAILQGLLLWEFFRRRWFLAGSLLFYAFAVNFKWLDLTLQARGYGILGLSALVSCLLLWHFLEDRRIGWLIGLGVTTVLGAWTVPNYVFFAGALWLLLWLAVREWRVFLGAGCALAGVVFVYLPVIGALRTNMTGYERQWGRTYTSFDDVSGTITGFLLSPQVLGRHLGNLAVVGGAVVAVVAAHVLRLERSVRVLIEILLGAAALFFGASVMLGTTPARTTAFIVVPVALALAILAAAASRLLPRGFMPIVAVALVFVASVHAIQLRRSFEFVPIENWRMADAYVGHTFPDGTYLASTRDSFGILRGAYLEDGYRVVPEAALHPRWLANGRTVVFDFSIAGPPHLHLGVPGVFSDVRFRQRRGHYLRVLAVPPLQANVDQVIIDRQRQSIGGLTDHRAPTGSFSPSPTRAPTVVEVRPTPGLISRSVTLLFNSPVPAVLDIATVSRERRTEHLTHRSVTTGQGLLSVALGDQVVERVRLVLAPKGHTGLALSEVWMYPRAWP